MTMDVVGGSILQIGVIRVKPRGLFFAVVSRKKTDSRNDVLPA